MNAPTPTRRPTQPPMSYDRLTACQALSASATVAALVGLVMFVAGLTDVGWFFAGLSTVILSIVAILAWYR